MIYYVDASGSDAWPGSAAQPFRTPQYGCHLLHPGDVLNLNPGTYDGFKCSASGNSLFPIFIQKNPSLQGAVTITGNPSPNGGVQLFGSYLTLDGLEVTGFASTSGVYVVGKHCTVQHCLSHNNGWSITGFGGEGIILAGVADDALLLDNSCWNNREHGIYASGGCQRPVIDGNQLYGNGDPVRPLGGTGLQINSAGGSHLTSQAVVQNNRIYDNVHSGVNLLGCIHSMFLDDLIYGNGSFAMILAHGSNGNLIQNCTMVAATKALYLNNGIGTRLLKNILRSLTDAPLEYNDGNLPDSDDYSLYWSPGKIYKNAISGASGDFTAWQALGYDTNGVFADPLFVDPVNGDYHLQPGSPAILLGAGASL